MSDAAVSTLPAAEARRRAYLQALQVDLWVPRGALPFAPASHPAVLAAAPAAAPVTTVMTPKPAPVAAPTVTPPAMRPPVAERLRPAVAKPEAAPVAEPTPVEVPVAREPAPRFSLQLLQAGRCLVLVELPTGDGLGARDPAGLLLKDLLRAAGLPPEARPLDDEPIRWPLLSAGALDQGPAAAREFVQSYLAVRQERVGAVACLWLVGAAAARFAMSDAVALDGAEIATETGPAWTLPGLDRLLEEPALKAPLWQAMRRVRRLWMDER